MRSYVQLILPIIILQLLRFYFNKYSFFQANLEMNSALDFACGLAAGWSQILTGQPLDFIKIKIQLGASQNFSPVHYARQIFKDHGLLGFYRGSSSLFFGFSFTIAIEFTTYQACKKYLLRRKNGIDGRTPEQVLSLAQIFLSGAVVGSAVAFISCPVEYAKIQKQRMLNSKESSLKILFNQLYRNQFKNIFKGLSATILRDIIGSAFQYTSYENSVRQICAIQGIQRRNANTLQYLLSGSLAGLTYWTFAYPFDVVKTKLQAGEDFRGILRNFGRVAYRGFSVIALRSILVSGFSFTTFENAKRYLKLIKTSREDN